MQPVRTLGWLWMSPKYQVLCELKHSCDLSVSLEMLLDERYLVILEETSSAHSYMLVLDPIFSHRTR